MFAAAIVTGLAGVSLLALLVGASIAAERDGRRPGDPRCFVVETPSRQLQVADLEQALQVIRKDLDQAEPGQAAMVLVRSCR